MINHLLNGQFDIAIYLLFSIVIAFTVHEFAHAWSADYLGDPTPRQNGRVTLNPIKHLNLYGFLLIVATGFGWAEPVPTQPQYYRIEKHLGLALVALAGPLSNLLLAILGALAYHITNLVLGDLSLRWLLIFCEVFVSLNLTLLVFNLIPLPPLDGHKVAVGLFPYPLNGWFATLTKFGTLPLMILLMLGYGGRFDVIGVIIRPLVRFGMQLLL